MHELATSVCHMTLGERFSMTAQDIREAIDQFVEKTRRGIKLASYCRPREVVDPPVRGRGVNHGASRPTTPHPDVAGGSSWHRVGSTLAQFAGQHETLMFGCLFRTPLVTNGNFL